jgi:DNA polymerase-3 subunit delta
MNRGTPLPMAMNEARVWGVKQRLFERVAPHFSEHQLAHLVDAASTCDGIVKGLRDDDWPPEPWDALRRLVLMLLDCTAAAPTGTRAPRGAVLRLAIHA